MDAEEKLRNGKEMTAEDITEILQYEIETMPLGGYLLDQTVENEGNILRFATDEPRKRFKIMILED